MLTRIAKNFPFSLKNFKKFTPVLAKSISNLEDKTFSRAELMRNNWRMDYGSKVFIFLKIFS